MACGRILVRLIRERLVLNQLEETDHVAGRCDRIVRRFGLELVAQGVGALADRHPVCLFQVRLVVSLRRWNSSIAFFHLYISICKIASDISLPSAS